MSVQPSLAYDIASSPCGGLWIRLLGVRALMRSSGALWLEEARTLIVADLHLEKGSAYASRGQLLPPFDTGDSLGRLEREAAALDPQMLVLLGDSFHDRMSEDRLAPENAERLQALAAARRLTWIVGNHDSEAPRFMPGDAADLIQVQGLMLRHEPHSGPYPGEVSGHLHPCARVAASAGRVRRRCFVTDGERVILPAFGAFAGGLNIRDQAFSGLFARQPIAAVLGKARVHAIGWRSLAPD